MQWSQKILSVEKQKGLTTSHINIQLDPFASKLAMYKYLFQIISNIITKK